LEGLDYLHKNGVAHRDLKPENLLLTGDFKLKIADFGFSKKLSETINGITKTRLGTESYMAPEILFGKPYMPTSCDLFASAVILFILLAGHPPFAQANYKRDHWYNLIAQEKYDQFWALYEKNRPAGFYSADFKNLISAMLSFNPSMRPSMADVVAHPWVKSDNVATHDEVINDLSLRFKRLEAQRMAERE